MGPALKKQKTKEATNHSSESDEERLNTFGDISLFECVFYFYIVQWGGGKDSSDQTDRVVTQQSADLLLGCLEKKQLNQNFESAQIQ